MKTVIILLLFCHAAFPVKYYLEFDRLLSSGFPNVHEYVVTATVQGVTTFYLNNDTTVKVTHNWMRELIRENKEDWDWLIKECRECRHMFKAETESFNQHSSKTEGGHIIQQIIRCEWDDEADKLDGYVWYGNSGEDFIVFDMKTETWITSEPEAETVKQEWDGNEVRNRFWKDFITTVCPMWLNKSLTYGKSYLNRKDLPSVSLLQKNCSSPVTCHITGFYPDRAETFWRKDGEQIHEGVKHGDILPNQDESFQMSVDLEVSSVPSEDWMRYDCVFQLSGVQNVITMKLDKDVIKSNHRKALTGTFSEMSIVIITAVTAVLIVVVIIIIVGVIRFIDHKKKNGHEMRWLPVQSEPHLSNTDPQ